MATKKVRCTLCDGSGFVTRVHKTEKSCGIARATCPRCRGTGQKEVPMTNGDRYRAMSDREMAETLSKTSVCPPVEERLFCGDEEACMYCWLEHLRSPVKERA